MVDAVSKNIKMIKSQLTYSILAALFFLLVKIFWVYVPIYSMVGARLGDDSLVYLQSGKSNILNSDPYQEIQLQVKILGETLSDDNTLEFNRARVLMRSTFIAATPYSFMAAAVESMGFTKKISFAMLEIIVSVVLTYSIWFFTRVLFNDQTSALVLLCLSFAIFPNQGIHYLVPSVLTLSLGLILWGLALNGQRSALLFFLDTFLVVTSHQIGFFYLAVAAVILIINAFENKPVTLSSFKMIAALIFGLAVAILCAKIGGAYASGRGTGIITIAGLRDNFAGLYDWLLIFAKNQRLIFIAAVAGCVIFICKRKFFDRKAILFTLLYGALLVSLFHHLEGYPGELASRILVPLVIYSLGFFFHECYVWGWNSQKVMYVYGLAVLMVISQISYFKTIFYRNMSSRPNVVNERLVGDELNQLKAGDKVIWMDADYAMQLGILIGVPKGLNNLPLPMVDKNYVADFIKSSSGAVYAVANYPFNLNAMSIAQLRTLDPRYYGFGFKYFQDVKISIDDNSDKDIFVKFVGVNVTDIRIIDEAESICMTELVSERENEIWVKVNKCNKFSIYSKRDSGSVRGIQMTAPQSAVAWPWGRKEITISGRVKGGGAFISQNFDWSNVLDSHSFLCLINDYNEWMVVSDNSGLIWIKRKD